MGTVARVRPDTGFVREVVGLGGDSVKKCFQCATCSVVCPLATDDNPFPRKEMLWAQWGLREKLVNDPSVWACHQCNDCSVHCPREAGPGDVMAALRAYCIGLYAVPGFMGKAFREPKYLPLLLAVPVVLFIILLSATGYLAIPDGEIVFKKFVPHTIVDPLFLVLVGLVLVSVAVSLSRFWKAITSGDGTNSPSLSAVLRRTAVPLLVQLLLHKKFRDCGSSTTKSIAHLTIFYGCLAFALVTGSIFIGTYAFDVETPLSQYHPLKIIANAGTLAVLVGCSIVVYRRLRGGKETGGSSYLDWNLVLLILAVVLAGVLTEVTRLADAASAAYTFYFIHLVLVFYGIAYFPYSKLAHLLYRSLAVLYVEYKSLEAQPAGDRAS
jgi:quinone-modifying oxidoreductase subunit QmoC